MRAVEEVRNDLDLARHAELLVGRRRAGSRDTAVTRSDCSIEKATISEYDGSLPTSVMSVPCSVVTTRGALPPCAPTHLPRQERRRSRAASRSARG